MREWLNSFRPFADSTPRVMERQMIPGAVWKTTACLLRDSLRRASRGETLSASLYYASLVFQRARVTIAPTVMKTRSASGKGTRWNWLIYASRDERELSDDTACTNRLTITTIWRIFVHTFFDFYKTFMKKSFLALIFSSLEVAITPKFEPARRYVRETMSKTKRNYSRKSCN